MRALAIACLAACLAACTSARPAAPAFDPAVATRYLALGDSFTIGTGSPPDQSYPARLTALASCRVELRNLGVNGFTTEDVIAQELPELARFAPAFVTLAIGANDLVQGVPPEVYRAHVRTVLAAVQAAGVKHVVTLPQPDWSLSPAAVAFGAPAALHARIVEANAIVRDETLAVGGRYVELFPLMETQAQQGLLAYDGLHPSAAAYGAWAAALAADGVSPCER